MAQDQNKNGQQDIYIDDFDFTKFKEIYDKDVSDLEFHFEICNENRDIRRNNWANKSTDLKKHDDDAFPYNCPTADGSSPKARFAHTREKRQT